ncbi:8-amino-7-oxononanoate synthase [Bacillus vallismortis]|uniref:8-amino-7-ketopelargonate synthase n=1 Tax=Bacillus vallismortis TaxID=72361 RepID=A0AAP3FVC2_BACVA|nr:8-amino-7-oxononanoate synthase [Bacillus vallismortis]MCI3985279.1 8-amino-7-oxononanoate synthase [Bacillus vallismortis]MCY8310032.1 8-amino-7-oxononanoate synthase [Bacillus vallismortis]MCY8316940.1 8-amino-7-oxononanoate synthase [Bacillus vallismortis]MCY8425755.1 8-amino-7-oxononanoate synthase [Bacillus vallismortis]MCY8547688.1 8-amino-7-oxononanoate synthase [Bacillus vallismortis]
MKIDAWLNERLDRVKEAGIYRNLRTMDGAPIPERNIDGENQTVWSSNNYLGLASHSRLISAAQEALRQFGAGSSGSRLTTGNSVWHEKLEKKIAAFKRTEAALLFSSGYLANVGILSSLPEKEDVILSDELNHASIIDGCRLSKADTMVYPHIDMDDLENKLRETQRYQRRFIVTDGVFSMDGAIAPLDQIISLAKRYHAFVIVDDAHATGVLGDSGRGTSEYFGVCPDIVVGTLSKAVGTEGGFAAGSAVSIDFLLNHARTFIFQTAIPPASCAAAYEAFNIIEAGREKRKRLFSYINMVRTGLTNMGYLVKGAHTPIIPVIIGDARKTVTFAEKLEDKGIYAPAIRPPTVAPGESRIRLTVTADHRMSDIDHLLTSFHSIGKELHII